ncbi:MAG: PQQ-binding-like beta-propeller repeat protein [Candidatus Bathyarchaeota archaeon]|nr:PQQ-binding-like beta-propeller repeat protein [Candidatus Bathyarchaeota archaeon]
MQKNTNKTIFALFMILAISIPLLTIPTVTADTRATYAYIGATPNPVGVNQETLLHIGITQQLSLVQESWTGLTVTVTRPDGSKETLGPFKTDSTGGTGAVYVPTMEGNYTLQTHFPEQKTETGKTTPGTPLGTTMLASDSRVLTLIVQQDPIPIYPEHALPTEYWSRPIDSQLRDWSTISASWLATPSNSIANGNDYAPETAHILWNHPLVLGGLAGGDLGAAGAYTGDAYEGKFSGSLIIQGILFYVKFDSIGGTAVDNWVVAVDLHSGQILWEKPLLTPAGERLNPSFGQIYNWDSFNAHGTHAYLWCTSGTTWHAFDPLTGRWLFSMSNVPTGSNLYGPHGEIIRYQVDLTRGYMTMWNSSAVIDAYWGTDPMSFQWGSWRPQGKTLNATGTCRVTASTPLGLNGYQWNVTIPRGLPGSAYLYKIDDRVVGSNTNTTHVQTWAISLAPGSLGTLLYNKVWNAPADWVNGNQTISRAAGNIDDGLIAVWSKETQQYWGFSTQTGDYIWGPTGAQNYLDYLGLRTFVAYGKLFSQGMSGVLYCYDAQTGKLQWTYEADDPYNQVLWSNQWHIRPLFFTNGRIYMGTSEHSPVDPKTRGGPFACVDTETGEEIFRADGLFRQTDWGGRAIIGDSIIATMDSYDQQVYAIGKGPSATTVTAPDVSVDFGKSVVIKGTVTDKSPGTKQYAIEARFPNGVPAVSDNNQSAWMLYVYKNFERPTNINGVEISLDVIDSNGNYRNIGTTISDASGTFSYIWTPDIEGAYTLTATFGGSKAYYPSFAQTSFAVGAPEATPAPIPQITLPPIEMYVIAMGIAIIIAIAIVGLILLMTLKRRP